MKTKGVIISILFSLLPAALAMLFISDLYEVYLGKGDYPFGSEFVSHYSIYTSKTIYVCYELVEIISLLTTVYFILKRKWKGFFLVLIFIDCILLLYPMFTASD